MLTFDQAVASGAYTMDTAGSFLINQLTKYDWTVNDPLVNITWDRDVPRRGSLARALSPALRGGHLDHSPAHGHARYFSRRLRRCQARSTAKRCRRDGDS